METPENFVDAYLLWSDWARTEIGVPNYSVVVGSDSFGSALYTKTAVDGRYPGFVCVYESLSCIGCDRHFVTDVLKFCILHADGMDLAQFLEQSDMLSKVETALAIGLAGDELTTMLMTSSLVTKATNLPSDFGV